MMEEKKDTTPDSNLALIKQQHKLRVNEEAMLLNILQSMHADNAITQAKTEEQIRRDAYNAMQKYRQQQMSRMSALEKQEHLNNAKVKLENDIKSERANLQRQIDMYKALAATDEKYRATVEQHEQALQKKEEQWAKDTEEIQKGIARVKKKALDEEAEEKMKALRKEEASKKASVDRAVQYEKDKKKATGVKGAIEQFKEGNVLDPKSGGLAALLNGAAKANPANFKENLKANAQNKREKADASAARVDELNSLYDKLKAEGADEATLAKVLEEGQQAQLEATKDANEAAAAEMASAVADAISGQYTQAVNQAETILNDYMGVIDARMQGSDKNFKEMSDKISSNLSLSPFVKTTKVLDQLKEAADKGISYNIEQRSFLSSISDRIASTFDAFDSNLMRIIRLQQADSTASRLGMEASLNKLFNNMFEDTSYLSSVADSISGAIVDAQSQLDYKASAEFEYVVQKWLGALSSLGMSDDALSEIAKGLNSLATGDVTGLASNNSMQTMFAMAASNANLEYSELLLKGLDANTTNKLLESMVVYLKDIADNSENQVVKAAYGDIFNLSHSDMRALNNLKQSEITSLAGNMMSYDQMQSELNNQFNQLIRRTSLSTIMTNVYENVLYGVASDMVNNPVTFAMQKMLNWMNETNTDIAIPFVNAAGFGLDVNASVGDLMQMGLGIAQGLSLAGNILSGLSSGGGLDLDSWDASETTRRGTGLELSTLSTLGGVSGSIGTYSTNSNSTDVKNSTMSSATDDAEESKKITNKNSKPPDKTIDDLFKCIIGDSAEQFVRSRDSILELVYQNDLESLRVHIKDSQIVSNSLLVYDRMLESQLITQNTIVSNLNNILHSSYGTSASSFLVTKDSTLSEIYSDAIQALNVNIVGIDDKIPFLATMLTSLTSPINEAEINILDSVGLVEGKVDNQYGEINIDLDSLLTLLNENKPVEPDFTEIITAIQANKPLEVDLSPVTTAIGNITHTPTDLTGVITAINGIKIPAVDLSPVVTAINGIEVPPTDLTEVVNAINNIEHPTVSLDPVVTKMDELLKDTSAESITNQSTALSAIKKLIEEDLKPTVTQLKTDQASLTPLATTITQALDTSIATLAVDQSFLVSSMEGILRSVLGDTSTSSINVDNSILDSTYNGGAQSLKVTLDGLNYNEGRIPVFDAAVETASKDGLSTINATLTEHMANGVQTVKLVEGTIIKLDSQQLTSALREVLFNNESKDFNTLISTITDGNLKISSVDNAISVKNATGEKLQVSNLVW